MGIRGEAWGVNGDAAVSACIVAELDDAEPCSTALSWAGVVGSEPSAVERDLEGKVDARAFL